MILIDHQWQILILIAILGLLIGSFLNVVIYRLPLMLEEETNERLFNLWIPPSHCPSCSQKLRWYDNIPLLSFLFQFGKCRYCKNSIGWRYPFVELLTMLISVIVMLRFPHLEIALLVLVFSWFLIPMIFIDFDHQILPDALTLGFLWVGLFVNGFEVFTHPKEAILGVVVGYLFFWLIAKAYFLFRRVEGLGRGDFKLFAALGAWLGWQPLPIILIIAGVLALIVNVFLILFKRKNYSDAFAFGPYLAVAGWIFMMVMKVHT
jgi:leader peptidase (prepilin peptidase) / N-methyltransferase